MRIHLAPYTGPQSRTTCPGCGTRRSFKLYLNEAGEPIGPEFGKCDRENNCGYHLRPEYANLPSTGTPAAFSGARGYLGMAEPKNVDCRAVSATFSKYEDNPLAVWMYETLPFTVADAIISKYLIGTGRNNATIFWHMDTQGNYRNGKRISYKPDGHRNKENPPSYTHRTADGYDIPLYGLHLLNAQNISQPVCIVESEKSAAIMSAYAPDCIWIASGGSTSLTANKIQPLKGRQVVLIPDLDKAGRQGFTKAFKEVSKIAYPAIFDINPEEESGADILDKMLADDYYYWEGNILKTRFGDTVNSIKDLIFD